MKKMITKTQLLDVNKVLLELQTDPQSTKNFSYLVSRNIQKIKPEIDSIIEFSKPSEGFIEYEKERLGICVKYCIKGQDDKPMNVNGSFDFPFENQPIVALELSELFKKFEDVLKLHGEQQNEIDKILSEEIGVEFHPISYALIPKTCSGTKLEKISYFIKETEEEILEIINNE